MNEQAAAHHAVHAVAPETRLQDGLGVTDGDGGGGEPVA